MKKIILLVLSIFIFTTGTMAQESKWKVRFRMASFDPNDDSTTLAGSEDDDGQATYVDVDSDFVPEVDVTYMFNEHWGLEVIAAKTTHTIISVEGVLAGKKIGDVSLLPPTFTASGVISIVGAVINRSCTSKVASSIVTVVFKGL